jgi:DNA-binding NtrC family response regulator
MEPRVSRILVVDDEKLIRWGLRRALEDCGYQVDEAGSAAEAIGALHREPPDVVLLDYQLPDRTGVEVLRELKVAAPRVPAVMITAHASIDGAVEAMREGAYDYVEKPFEVEELTRTVARALEIGRLREEVARRREEGLREFGVEGLVAASPAMGAVVRLIRRVAKSEATTILLLGESGVGKGMVAHALHAQGTASERPFMHITCTALPETLLESELFGHEKGPSRTRARRSAACSSSPTEARCSWTRSATCRRRCRGSSCASSRTRPSAASAGRGTSRWRCASSRPRTRTSPRR